MRIYRRKIVQTVDEIETAGQLVLYSEEARVYKDTEGRVFLDFYYRDCINDRLERFAMLEITKIINVIIPSPNLDKEDSDKCLRFTQFLEKHFHKIKPV